MILLLFLFYIHLGPSISQLVGPSTVYSFAYLSSSYPLDNHCAGIESTFTFAHFQWDIFKSMSFISLEFLLIFSCFSFKSSFPLPPHFIHSFISFSQKRSRHGGSTASNSLRSFERIIRPSIHHRIASFGHQQQPNQ